MKRSRTYRPVKRTRLTKKRITDIASTKKRDNMSLYDPDNTTNNYFSQVRGGASYLWCPTARLKDATGIEDVDRVKSMVYMKGLREKVELVPNNGAIWKWRRIVFETKGIRDTSTYQFTSDGYRRLWRKQSPTSGIATANTVFEGTSTSDLSTYFTAKVDRNAVKVHFDKTRVIRSGNDFGGFKTARDYYPFNRSFRYEEDEDGGHSSTSHWATLGNHYMGDVYVWDIITDAGAPNSTDFIVVRGDATIYWHEK